MGEALSLGAVMVEAGNADNVIAMASSQFCQRRKTV